MITIALAGNPNTGKTTLFNILTGSYEYVGNWPGVTVEKKIGLLRNKQGRLIDLPGIYSLNPLSKDEGVATQYLVDHHPDVLLNIVDASQLERNLYLTVQLLEYGAPMVIGLNMTDVAKARGFAIDETKLAEKLQCSVLPIVARTGAGCQQLADSFSQVVQKPNRPFHVNYGGVLEETITTLVELLPASLEQLPPKRWLALQFLEGNQLVSDLLEKYVSRARLEEIYKQAEANIKKMEGFQNCTLQQYIRKVRSTLIYDMISSCREQVRQVEKTWTDRIDSFLTHKFLGLPIFLLFMYLTFKLTFEWIGAPISDAFDDFLGGPFTDWLRATLEGVGVSEFLQAALLDGVVAGVGGVLVFIPQIFVLFFLISLIEDSGYMARVAMVMDKIMEMIGLNGKAFIPMIIGFGCNVPGVMAARSIEQPKERLLTILLTPLMSCSARLPIYSLFVGTFFAANQAIIVLSIYVLGIVLSLLLAKLFSSTVLKQEGSMFIIELPPYRIPQGRTLFRSTWEKVKGFIRKAGTFIFGGSIVIWFLSYAGPAGLDVELNDSFLAMIGGGLAPLLIPLGFGTWQAGAALITGFLAKEVVVSTMNIIYAAPDDHTLQAVIQTHYSSLSAYSFMVFVLLYVPCLATVAVIKKETGSTKWTWFSVLYGLGIAYVVSFIIYQVGTLLGF
ncbi:ferrous iron transport protein B [Brevibacillus laterosporus]|uniref:ferrous iron transport protein B n=1 Tax=Brevibacillus laterosporus TaxID=1465 RepID=UPI000839C35E|nr:ferrous iron transport protein B [Brevibacillus laterosporus]